MTFHLIHALFVCLPSWNEKNLRRTKTIKLNVLCRQQVFNDSTQSIVTSNCNSNRYELSIRITIRLEMNRTRTVTCAYSNISHDKNKPVFPLNDKNKQHTTLYVPEYIKWQKQNCLFIKRQKTKLSLYSRWRLICNPNKLSMIFYSGRHPNFTQSHSKHAPNGKKRR